MNHPILTFLFLLCSMTRAAADFHPKPDEIWVLVAKSSLIVTGTLNVPVEQIRKRIVSGKHDWVNLTVKRDQVIKGTVPPDFKVKCYTKSDDSSPDPEQVIKLNGQKVMLFLTLDDDVTAGNPEGHFEGLRQYSPLNVVDAMAAILNQITAEDFGNMVKGSTERGRKQAADGWAMYLYYWKLGDAAPVQVKSDRKSADSIEASDDFRASAIAADKLMVSEGLPHQMQRRDLFFRESKRKDVTKIAGYSFYTPAIAAKEQEKLKTLLGDPKNIALYRGEKLCGGFHPDYVVVWESGGKIYQVHVCYGCHQVCFVEGRRKLMYEMADGPWACLSNHAAKCPAN